METSLPSSQYGTDNFAQTRADVWVHLHASVPASGLASDLHADADYRAHLIGVLAKRAVTAAG